MKASKNDDGKGKEYPDLTYEDKIKMYKLAEGIYDAIMKSMEQSMGGPVRVRKVIDLEYPLEDKRKGSEIIVERVPPDEVEKEKERVKRIKEKMDKEFREEIEKEKAEAAAKQQNEDV